LAKNSASASSAPVCLSRGLGEQSELLSRDACPPDDYRIVGCLVRRQVSRRLGSSSARKLAYQPANQTRVSKLDPAQSTTVCPCADHAIGRRLSDDYLSDNFEEASGGRRHFATYTTIPGLTRRLPYRRRTLAQWDCSVRASGVSTLRA
jgi:hypothetical protein